MTPAEQEIRVLDRYANSCGDFQIANNALQNYSKILSGDTERSSRKLTASVLSGLRTGHFKMEVVQEDGECGNSSNISTVIPYLFDDFVEADSYLKSIPRSCEDVFNLFPTAPSDYYNIMVNTELISVYCYKEGTNCGGDVWTRIASFNMSQPGAVCPSGLNELTYSNLDHPVCGRPTGSNPGCCASVSIPSYGLNYSSVCGYMRGYQYRSPDAFYGGGKIDDSYVDGYSITYGSPKKHIWTYAGGLEQEVIFITSTASCPCNINGNANNVPSFVGSDYYCESALPIGEYWDYVLYADDPLWDGEQCIGDESPCCTNHMPWFSKPLGVTTNDDIEVRLCGDQSSYDEDTPMDILELYIR